MDRLELVVDQDQDARDMWNGRAIRMTEGVDDLTCRRIVGMLRMRLKETHQGLVAYAGRCGEESRVAMHIQEATLRNRAGRGPGRARIDVERLLHWAYRDELPKGGGEFESAQMSPMFKWADLGGRVDDWSHDPGFPTIMGEPHPDALRIQHYVSRLEDVELDWDYSSRRELMGDLLALAPEEPPTLLGRLRTAALVTMHAAMGTRPDWEHEALTCHRVIGSHGRAVVQRVEDGELVEGVDKSNHYGKEARCPLHWEPRPTDIVCSRAEYAAWHAGLVGLAGRLCGELDEYDPQPPTAPAQPWAVAGPGRRVLQAIFP